MNEQYGRVLPHIFQVPPDDEMYKVVINNNGQSYPLVGPTADCNDGL